MYAILWPYCTLIALLANDLYKEINKRLFLLNTPNITFNHSYYKSKITYRGGPEQNNVITVIKEQDQVAICDSYTALSVAVTLEILYALKVA